MSALRALESRLDRQAIHQLRAEVVRLASQMEELTRALEDAEQRERWAEDSARFWQDVAEAEAYRREIGITQDGQVVALPICIPAGIDISGILRAQACDNLPPEVCHDDATASTDSALEPTAGIGTRAEDDAECGAGDQELGICSDCGKPVTKSTGYIHAVPGFSPYAFHYNCIPF